MDQREMNEYLGDGVYASFDGYQIWLAANHHENRVIALDPHVLEALLKYAQRIGIWTPKQKEGPNG
jgi:hypothetical protein